MRQINAPAHQATTCCFVSLRLRRIALGIRRTLALLGVALLALLLAPAPEAGAQGPNRAGLVIRFGDGSVSTACVQFSEPQISGLELVLRSGLEVIIEQGGMYGSAVCKIGGEGCDFPLDDCFCQCVGVDCTYWAYYHLRPDGVWEYSPVGASSYSVQDGAVEGWSWGPGDYGASGTEPPAITFEQICAPPATATYTPPPTSTPTSPPTATPTPRPTSTPTPTFLPSPTATPTLPPASIEFWADRTEVVAGQCLNLSWRVSGVLAVYLNGQGVTGEETRQVCPSADTTYTLRAITPAGEEQRQIVVHAIPPTPAFTPPPTQTPAAPAAAKAASTVTPTAQPRATHTATATLPPPSPTAPAATHTPALLAAAPRETPTPLPTSTFTVAPPTHTPARATAVARAAPPTPTPQIWARAETAGRGPGSRIPTPSAPRETQSRENAPAPGRQLLLDYGAFFIMAALLVAAAAWTLRREMGRLI